jgi:hypothetical protein
MSTCSMGFEHESPEPEVTTVTVDSGTNENDVAIAEINAAAEIKREKIYAEQRDMELVAEVERQAGEIAGMRAILDRIAPPEPDPADVVPSAPVVVAPAAAVSDSGPEEVAAPPDVEKKAPKKSGGYWDGYDRG